MGGLKVCEDGESETLEVERREEACEGGEEGGDAEV